VRCARRKVLVKLEVANPLGSFKGRGADFLVRSLPPGSTVAGASSGNFGVALAYAARARGMSAHVFISPDIRPARLAAVLTGIDPDPAVAGRAPLSLSPAGA
jgi:threonine dehydratase